ncbi:hypothetical protein SAY86_001631 [Trapa natans]|uniref:Mesoderm development candidate 2 n=1 Tax=Trapa natans TaxID=22666 RepID=A0AAN7LSI9_TRANT|nr:hypothetical protein SAY86_001631 [Trapa natans]
MGRMKSKNSPSSIACLLLYLIVLALPFIAEPVYRRVHITDDLDDVVDDEEDEHWKQWGQSSRPESHPDLPPDLSNMDLSQIQEETMRRHLGPTFGFVKLRLGVHRTPDSVSEIANRWNRVLKTGGIEATFNPVDLNTIMFTLLKGRDTMELKEFLLDQLETYEVKIGDRAFRRAGDPSLDEIVEKLHTKEEGPENIPDEEDDQDWKEEL